MSLGSQEA